jgi:predicted TIM-barrel fold metal-dependent hydrolase
MQQDRDPPTRARTDDAPAAVPNSAGTARPRLHVPADACDSHLHIIDPRFATTDPAAQIAGATVADFRLLQRRLGTARAVLVQPKAYGIDNACLLDALARLGNSARGVAVVHPSVSDAELTRLDAGGVRGVRFSVWKPSDTVTTIDMIEPLARRGHALGWHVQLHMSADQIADNAALIGRLPGTVVIDHVGRLPPPTGTSHPAFAVIARLLERGRTWMKLSGPYLNTLSGPPAYADASAVARAFARIAPERMVWGSDWPHVTESHKPDDAVLLDLVSDWVPDAADQRRLLVDNPAVLYGFA